MNGIWGKTRICKTVHFYLDGSKTSICGRVTGRDFRFSGDWDEHNQSTCKHCAEQLKTLRAGFIPEPIET